MGPISQGTALGKIKEVGLLCHSACLMECSPSIQSEINSFPSHFPEVLQDLALSLGLGITGDWKDLEVALLLIELALKKQTNKYICLLFYTFFFCTPPRVISCKMDSHKNLFR